MLPDLTKLTNWSNRLVDRFTYMFCKSSRVHLRHMPTTILPLFQACETDSDTSILPCMLHNAPFDYIATANEQTIVKEGVVDIKLYVLSKQADVFLFVIWNFIHF